MTDNPYRFTVKVIDIAGRWYVAVTDPDDRTFGHWGSFPTEAEANEHAAMILTALQGATRE